MIVACCYDNKEGHLPANLAKPAIFPYVRVENGFVSLLFLREGGGKLCSTLVLANMACLAGTAKQGQAKVIGWDSKSNFLVF